MPRALLFMLLLSPAMLKAHHSVALNFSQEEIILKGTITDLKYINPHGSFIFVVTRDDGTTEEWTVELLAKIALERQGFDFEQLQNGMEIELTGRVGIRERTLLFEQAVHPDGHIVVERDPSRVRFTR